MTTHSLWRRFVAAGFACIPFVVFVLSSDLLLGQEVPPTNPSDVKKQPEDRFAGSTSCAPCHSSSPDYMRGGKDDRTDWINANEFQVWHTQDVHSLAYDRMDKSSLTDQIGRQMKINPRADARCLACHFPFDERQRGSSFVGQSFDGINCEVCHGAAERWFFRHRDKEWRQTPTDEKVRLGLRDLSHPTAQAVLCLSCHLAQPNDRDPLQNRIVTHEMYAAGHPLLPGVEVASFATALPRHWRYDEEKLQAFKHWLDTYSGDGIDKSQPIEEILHKDRAFPMDWNPRQHSRTRHVVLGNILALTNSMDWVLANTQKRDDWPRLETYDCYACHHELRTSDNSARQKRAAIGGRPGRPMLRRWPIVLARLAVSDAAHRKTPGGPELLAAIDQLDQTFAETPFGDPDRVMPAANAVKDACDRLLAGLNSATYTEADAKRLFAELARIALRDDIVVDYDSSRQVGWALRTLWQDFGESKTGDAGKDASIEQGLRELTALLDLDLPARRDSDRLGVDRRKLADYDANLNNEQQQFREIVSKLAVQTGSPHTARGMP